MNPDNVWGLCITAAAGTELATSYSLGTVTNSSFIKAVYTPRGVFLHAASLHHTFVHCGIFLTAASRRSLGSVSVPVRQVTLSRLLLIIVLVGLYPTNKLIRHRPLLKPRRFTWEWLTSPHDYQVLIHLSMGYPCLRGRLLVCYSPVCRSVPHRSGSAAQLACLKHAANVRPEPGSNSQWKVLSKSFQKSHKANAYETGSHPDGWSASGWKLSIKIY